MKELVVALLATLVIQALTAVTVFAPAVLAPAASGDIGIAASAIGAFTSLVYLFASLSAPIGGTFVPRLGGVRMSQICLVLGGSGLMMGALAHPAAVIAATALIGAGYGPVTPASAVLLIERTPDRMRNLVMSIRQTGVPVGGAFAGAVVPWLAVSAGWRAAALAMGGLCLAFALVLQFMRRRYDHPGLQPAARRPPLTDLLRMVLTHRQLRRVSFTAFAYAGMQLCLASYLVVFLVEKANLSVLNAGAALSTAMLAGIVGRVLWGIAADYFASARAVLALLGAVMAACAASVALITPAWPFGAVLALCAVYGATAVGWNGVYIAEVARIAPGGKVAIATGASLAFTFFGVVVGPFFFWLIVTFTGSYAAAFGSAALVTLAAAVSIMR